MATKTTQVGNHIVRAALVTVRRRQNIHYSQDMTLRWGGIRNKVRLPDVPVHADCSSLTTWLMHNGRIHIRGTAGEDVVNGTRWKSGYTGTQLTHGKRHRFGTRFWRPGLTLVFYGRPHDISHVAIYVGKDGAGRHMVVSHGSESGPHYVPYNYRSDYVESRLYPL